MLERWPALRSAVIWCHWGPCLKECSGPHHFICGSSDSMLSPQNSSAPLAEDIDPEVSSSLSAVLLLPGPYQWLLIPSFFASQLARYLNRNYWEKKQEEARKSPTPSAPVPLTEPAAQPGEGHTAPNSMVEVRGSSALSTVPSYQV